MCKHRCHRWAGSLRQDQQRLTRVCCCPPAADTSATTCAVVSFAACGYAVQPNFCLRAADARLHSMPACTTTDQQVTVHPCLPLPCTMQWSAADYWRGGITTAPLRS